MTMLSTAALSRLLPLPIVLALLFAPLQTLSDTAYACSCLPQTVEERVEGSDLAFVGKIVRFEGAWPVFAVERYYKGSGSAEVSVSDPLGGGASCSYFDEGGVVDEEREYLVFARYAGDYGYSTSLCSGNVSSDIAHYDAAVAEVASITGPGQPPDGSPPQASPPPEEPEAPEDDHTESTPWAVVLPLAFAIPLAVLVIPAFLRRRGGR